MANALTLTHGYNHSMGREVPYDLSVALSGNYGTGGETIDFTTLPLIKASRPPLNITLQNSPGGYIFEFVIGTSISNTKLKVYSAVGTELAAGAYPAGVSGATVNFRAHFRKNL